jgi:ureidoglycolate dehydrogenase (NAD+)
MEIKIDAAKKIATTFLQKLNFSKAEIQAIVDHLIEAELCGKKTHGFLRLSAIKRLLNSPKDKIEINNDKIEIIKETPCSFLVDGKKKIGLYVLNHAIEYGIKKCKMTGITIGGVTNTSAFSGMIGFYAKKAADENLIYIGFNNSSSAIVPFGLKHRLWGTNPFTVGIPTNNLPIILDMASTSITFGQIMLAISQNMTIPSGVAVDKEGHNTTDPKEVQNGGGLLPFSGYKASGLAFIVEILAGALTSSLVGEKISGGWGSLFILINPELYRPIKEFKSTIEAAIQEFKMSEKADEFSEIYYPGEKSQKKRQENLKKTTLEIDEIFFKQLQEI